jgi:hypothetical protein
VLFFELFPAFLTLVSVIVGIVLYASNRRSKDDPDIPKPPRPSVKPGTRERLGIRPSMRA